MNYMEMRLERKKEIKLPAVLERMIPREKIGCLDRRSKHEMLFLFSLKIAAFLVIILLCAILLTLIIYSIPALKHSGLSFVSGTVWDPLMDEYGVFPFLAGTIITSLLALLLSLPFSLSISLYLGEYAKKGPVATFLQSAIEVMAGVPSVIFGFWGLFVMIPIVQKLQMSLGVIPYGVGIFSASIILSIMIIPYSSSLGSEVIRLVPKDLKEAAYSLGATRFEMIRKVVLPYARSGVFAGMLLSFGRALGETMAVTMVIGNSNFLPKSIFSPSNTMASIIANEFAEATGDLYTSSLICIGLVLFAVTTVINLAGKYVIRRLSVEE